mmetsp:Transcript_14534/g.22566  ORF Transcript_14534/g.22566 Transcript_14534/m.22566 type:complete len:225 (-) Transcript_14534:821-1495(-)
MRLYTAPKVDPKELEQLLEEYTIIRSKECMLDPAFASGLSSANGHIYRDALREQILKELGMIEPKNIDKIDWYNVLTFTNKEDYAPQHNVLEKYNLNKINNEEAIGYNKLEERAANLEKNADIAHESVFDKMLASYFLNARGETKKANQMIEGLEKAFRPEAFEPGITDEMSLGGIYNRNTMDKDDFPELVPAHAPALLDLDIALNNHLHNGQSALSLTSRSIL